MDPLSTNLTVVREITSYQQARRLGRGDQQPLETPYFHYEGCRTTGPRCGAGNAFSWPPEVRADMREKQRLDSWWGRVFRGADLDKVNDRIAERVSQGRNATQDRELVDDLKSRDTLKKKIKDMEDNLQRLNGKKCHRKERELKKQLARDLPAKRQELAKLNDRIADRELARYNQWRHDSRYGACEGRRDIGPISMMPGWSWMQRTIGSISIKFGSRSSSPYA